jgi:hypothetical protein
MTYTPDREMNPPCCYEIDVDKVDCVYCHEELEMHMAHEIGDTLQYLCDWCVIDVEEMDNDEVDDFVDEFLEGTEIFKEVIKQSNNINK